MYSLTLLIKDPDYGLLGLESLYWSGTLYL